MQFTKGQVLTGRWAGCTVQLVTEVHVWVRSPEGTFGVPAKTLIREMEETK